MAYKWLLNAENWIMKKKEMLDQKIDNLYKTSLPFISNTLGDLHGISKNINFGKLL